MGLNGVGIKQLYFFGAPMKARACVVSTAHGNEPLWFDRDGATQIWNNMVGACGLGNGTTQPCAYGND